MNSAEKKGRSTGLGKGCWPRWMRQCKGGAGLGYAWIWVELLSRRLCGKEERAAMELCCARGWVQAGWKWLMCSGEEKNMIGWDFVVRIRLGG